MTTSVWRRPARVLAAVFLFGVLVAAPNDQVSRDESPRDKISRLRRELARHDWLYQQATPEISDFEYDQLRERLAAIEHANPEAARAVPALADDRTGRFETKPHLTPMLSLDKTYAEADVRAFAARVERAIGREAIEYVVEPKFDGFGVSVVFEHGRLIRALTRGDGRFGEDITANMLSIRTLPRQLCANSPEGLPNIIPDRLELRGEVFVSFADFERVNAERDAADEPRFANPRALAAGTIRQLDPDEVGRRGLQVVFYALGECEPLAAAPVTQHELHARIAAWGLPDVSRVWPVRGTDELWHAIGEVRRERAAFSFPTDGAVAKVDSLAFQRELGVGESAPRWAMAFKFAPERATTRLRAITIQVGRTGVLTPVAELDPVSLGGTKVARATLHNRDEIARRDLRVGDCLVLEKAGEIIPAIVDVDRSQRPTDAVPFAFPETCPGCGGPVTTIAGAVAVRCDNESCPGRLRRQLEHFASRDGLDIRALGPATIDALVAHRRLASPADLYRLRRDDLAELPEVGVNTADQLLAAIALSRHAELWRVINGLGIPGVGTIAARELARRAGSLDGMMRLATADDAATSRDAAIRAAAAYFAEPSHAALVVALQALGVEPTAGTTGAGSLAGKTFVLTGTLPTLSRAAATTQIVAAGGRVSETVTRTTDYVVVGAEPGAKLARAQALSVRVIDEPALLELLGEH